MESSGSPCPAELTAEEREKLQSQESRGLLSEFHQHKLENEALKNWDKFYMRNEDRFFKDRNWTKREFGDIFKSKKLALLEVGCGVGNFFYPLLSEDALSDVYACDFSPRAIEMVKSNPLYDPSRVTAFVCDLTKDKMLEKMNETRVDVISLIFVLSAILPSNYRTILKDLYAVLKPGGSLIFRDYGINDMAMIRFGPGCKLGERLYVRQDGTRSYYFELGEMRELLIECGFEIKDVSYIHRRTINRKEGMDARRIFLQALCNKPL